MINTLKNEHLVPGEKPLHISLDYVQKKTIKKLFFILGFHKCVDWFASPGINKLLNNVNPEKNSYVISEVSSKNKYSRGYYDCTGIVLIGKNKEGKNISLLTHQAPEYLFCRFDAVDGKNRFQNDLQTAIDTFKIDAVPGTIDACIVGGNYLDGERYGSNLDVKRNFLQSVELLDMIIRKNFGFSPVVVNPNFEGGCSDIYVDTKNRRIYRQRGFKEDFIFGENLIFQASELKEKTPFLDEILIKKQASIGQILR